MSYKSAHSLLLLKAMQVGETVVHRDGGGELSTVSQPSKHLFASHPRLLASVKLRIAHAAMEVKRTVVSSLYCKVGHFSPKSFFPDWPTFHIGESRWSF